MYIAYCDGGSRGNPGPAAYAAVIRDDKDNQAVVTGFLGHTTNNVAEYQGLLAVLDYVVSQDTRSVRVFSDSMLLVRQIQRAWRVKNVELKKLWDNCQLLIARLDSFEIDYVPRELNKEADGWVNETLDIATDSK